MRPTYPMALGERDLAVPMARRVYFEVFGCQMNKLDAELMLESLLQAGYVLTHDPQRAGVILYNTCSVREHAEARVFSRLGALRKRKERHPELVIGLLGCIAQHHREQLLGRLSHLDLVVGTREFHRLPTLIEEVRANGSARVATDLDSPLEFLRSRNLGPSPLQAYVSVMRGCDMVCTYCIVPSTRGKEISRPPREIIEEIVRLAHSGVREVTLLGQTVNSYGKRLGDGIGLDTLLHGIEGIDGIDRVRFITSHPRFMRPRLIEAMAECSKVCEYLHLPVQSGSTACLRRMRRFYSREEYLTGIERLRRRIPEIALATDFIVGFPGETEEEFQESVTLVREVGFDHGYVFKYSPRPGTDAGARLADDVADEVKRERNQILLEELGKTSLEANRRCIGRKVEILVEGPSRSDPDRFTGRSRDHRIVVYPAQPGEEAGGLVDVEIEGATRLTLLGRRADPPNGALPR